MDYVIKTAKRGNRTVEIRVYEFHGYPSGTWSGYTPSRTRSGNKIHLSGINTRIIDGEAVLYWGNTAKCNNRSMDIYHVDANPTCERCLA